LVRFGILGPVQVDVDGTQVRLGRRRERLILGLLLLEAGSPVAVGRLIELVWPGQPPSSPRAALHTYLSRLRGTLLRAGASSSLITVEQRGYRIDAQRDSVDACRFADLVETATIIREPTRRSAQLAEALALWRGPPLADVASPELRDQLGARLVAPASGRPGCGSTPIWPMAGTRKCWRSSPSGWPSSRWTRATPAT
jgi:DNA-binding SARP family transcriptional activator